MPRNPIKKVAAKPTKASKRLAAKAKEQEKKEAAQAKKAVAAEWDRLAADLKNKKKQEKSIEEQCKKAEKALRTTQEKSLRVFAKAEEAEAELMAHVRVELEEARRQHGLPVEEPEPMLCNRCSKPYCDKTDQTGTTPRFLDCGHTMCEKCIVEQLPGKVVCPIEKKAHTVVGTEGVKKFRKNFCLMSLFE